MQRRYYIAVILYCAAIFWLSNQPSPPVPEVRFPGEDKVAHMILFGGLAGILSVGLHKSDRPLQPWVRRYGPILFATLYGLADEVHQLFISERTFSLLDLLADAVGATLAHGACTAWFRRQTGRASVQPDET